MGRRGRTSSTCGAPFPKPTHHGLLRGAPQLLTGLVNPPQLGFQLDVVLLGLLSVLRPSRSAYLLSTGYGESDPLQPAAFITTTRSVSYRLYELRGQVDCRAPATMLTITKELIHLSEICCYLSLPSRSLIDHPWHVGLVLNSPNGQLQRRRLTRTVEVLTAEQD